MNIKNVILELMVEDVAATISFYQQALQFDLLASEKDETGRIYWAKMNYRDFFIAFKDEVKVKTESPFMRGRATGGGACIVLVVDEIEPIHADIERRFDVLEHPHLTPCGSTQFSLMDNNGYVITFERF